MQKTYSAPAIHCHSCDALIRESLDGVDGIRSVHVDVGKKTVTLDYADSGAEAEVLARLALEGYPLV